MSVFMLGAGLSEFVDDTKRKGLTALFFYRESSVLFVRRLLEL